MSNALQRTIRQKLEGLGGRIIFRNAKRKGNNRRRVLRERLNEGLLGTVSACRSYLATEEIEFKEVKLYGLTMIRAVGVDIWYDREGNLSRHIRRKKLPPPEGLTLPMFSEIADVSSCAPDTYLGF